MVSPSAGEMRCGGPGGRPGDPFPAKDRGAADNPDWELLSA